MVDVCGYTLAQVNGHIQAIGRLEQRRLASQMQAFRVAAWGQAKDVERVVDSLQGVARAEDDQAEKALAAFGLRLVK